MNADDRYVLDETLGDGADGVGFGCEDVGRHRFIHGLLRAMHTADAGGHQSRVETIMSRLPARGRVWTRYRVAVAAVSATVIAVVAVFAIPDRDDEPRVEALVTRAADRLALEVDRHWEVEIGFGPVGRSVLNLGTHSLTARPGGKFILKLKSVLGMQHIGCDGEIVWRESQVDPENRWSVALVDRELLHYRLRRLGIFDLGHLDLENVLARLPGSGKLQLVGRERQREFGDVELLRIEAKKLPPRGAIRLENVVLLVDSDTGEVVFSEFDVRGHRGRAPFRTHLSFKYVGEVAPGVERYRRPW